MKNFTLQLQCWQDCNLNCLHCWRNAKFDKIKLNLDKIEKQITILYNHMSIKNIDSFHLKISGGEPFLYIKNIINLLDKLEISKKKKIQVYILTNGTIINNEIIHSLEKYKKQLHFQISIDGLKSIHDKIRGEGAFEISYKNALLLHNKGFDIKLQAVINKYNIKQLKQIIKLFCLSPMPYFQIRKTIPLGRSKNIKKDNIILNKMYNTISDMLSYIKKHNKQIRLGCDSASALNITNNLENIVSKCGVPGKALLGIEPNGDIVPCPRLPIKLGNIYRDDIIDIVDNIYTKKIEEIKHSNECLLCNHYKECQGGDLCSTYSYYNNLQGNTPLLCS